MDYIDPNKTQGASPEQHSNKHTGKKHKRFPTLLYVATTLILLAVAGYFFWQYQDLRNNPERVTKQEIAVITQDLAKLIDLPDGETPTLATIEDASKFDNQQFFVDAQNGDKILIYTEAKKVILYRQSNNRIINIGSIAITTSDAEKE